MDTQKTWKELAHQKYRYLIPMVFSLALLLNSACVVSSHARELYLLIPNDIHCGCESGDIYSPLAEILKSFETRHEVKVRLESLSGPFYNQRLLATLNTDKAPDVIWTDAPRLPGLAHGGRIISLTKMVSQWAPYDQFPEWIRKQFEFEGKIYGVPLSSEGDLRLNAYAITSAAKTRGQERLAFNLITTLAQLTPLKNLPDLVIQDLDIEAAENYQPGAPLKVHLTIRNRGVATEKRSEMVLSLDDQIVVRELIRPLGHFTSEELEFNVRPTPRWNGKIFAAIDPLNKIKEDNETNNSAIGTTDYGLSNTPPSPQKTSAAFCIDDSAQRKSAWAQGPKVAFNGKDYVVVWAKQTPLDSIEWDFELRAVRVSSSGTVLDPNGVLIVSGPKSIREFHIAAGAGKILVVWAEDKGWQEDPGSIVAGVIIEESPAGQLVTAGNPFVIEDTSTPASSGYPNVKHQHPVPLFTGSDFIVVYETDDDSGSQKLFQWADAKLGVYARRVTLQGIVTGLKNKLLAKDQNPTFQRAPVIAFDGNKWNMLFQGRYCAGNDYANCEFGIYSSIISLSGSSIQLTPPLRIEDKFENVRLAYGSNSYLAIWESDVGKPSEYYDPDLMGALGKFIGGASPSYAKLGPVVSGDVEYWPAVAFDGKNFTVMFSDKVGCKTYLAGVRVDSNGTFGTHNTFKDLEFITSVDLAFGTSNGLAVFSKFNPPSTYNGPDRSYGVCAQFIDKSP